MDATVFCFTTDDGRLSNLAWADVARDMGFRFTIAVNSSYNSGGTHLTGEQLHVLWEDGFEIANHSYSHGEMGLPESCPRPPKGSMAGYFMCEGIDQEQAMVDFAREIERDSVAVMAQMPLQEVRSFAYPRHRHTIAIIDALVEEGYLGARMGGQWSEDIFSYGDYTTYPHNSWDGGMSLFRMPNILSDVGLFGNHSASPPVHKTHEEFVAAAQPWIDQVRSSGGAFIVYSHHLGDSDDSLGDINYGSGGISAQDLEWIVNLVRDNGGVVMPFGEMCQYYRDRSSMVEIESDFVWRLLPSAVNDVVVPNLFALKNYPNPFNPRTVLTFALEEEHSVNIEIFDQAGHRVNILAREVFGPGEHSLVWNGVDESGRVVPAGQYFLRVEAGGRIEAHKMLLLK